MGAFGDFSKNRFSGAGKVEVFSDHQGRGKNEKRVHLDQEMLIFRALHCKGKERVS